MLRPVRSGIAGLVAVAVLTGLIQAVAVADESDPQPAQQQTQKLATTPPQPAVVPAKQRSRLLGKDWRTSADRAWTTSSDAQGFHILTADKDNGYGWKTAASLSEPGFDTDAWIGNACVTASGKHAVAVYAPRTFTNKPALMTRGAFTAVVDLTTGKVTKLPVQSSLAYFSPGCGQGESAVMSQFTDDSATQSGTRLVTVDAQAGKVGEPLSLKGQVTSAVPYRDGIAAAAGYQVVKIGTTGKRTTLATTTGVPFQLRTDRDGGVVFLDRTDKDRGTVKRAHAGRTSTLATGRLTDVDLTASSTGTVFITGKVKTTRTLPGTVKNSGVAKGATATTRGQAMIISRWQDAKKPPPGADALTARPLSTRIHTLATGSAANLTAFPGEKPVSQARMAQGKTTSPALTAGVGASKAQRSAAAASPTDPVEDERTCAVPRGSVTKQALQPTPRQAEWAVDQAVINGLDNWISRPANWNGTGMGAYSPQSHFPLHPLDGDPNGVIDRADEWHIPAQILLGITAQESNMWQATRTVVPGLTGNALIGNYYGIKYAADGNQGDPWGINWSKADCGYGITQVTDGMRRSDTSLSTAQKESAALDYTANIAYGADILTSKWNQTRKAGMLINDGKPKYIENWFFALWAYNSGFYPQSEAGNNGGKWGVGWTNNPANPLWKENRTPFLENASGADDYSHAANPQYWPYQEKVIGWAARPISAMFKPGDMQPGYRASWWNSNQARTTAKPPIMIFCTTANDCDNSKIGDGASNQTGKGPCTLPGDPSESDPLYLKCWWHVSVKWKDCEAAAQCGNPVHRFNNADYPEQPNENSSYPPRCSSGLPAGSLIVDDVPDGTRPAGQTGNNCGLVSSAGSFDFEFADWNGTYPGKIDLHQIGAGYGDHFWFTHTRQDGTTDGNRLKTAGTWTLKPSLNEWVRIMVHIPDHGAHTQQARYDIDTGSGSFSRHRYIGQNRKTNSWVSLGAYKVNGKPRVQLTSQTSDGTGDEDVAWDAVAFQPIGAKPKHIVAAIGDSYTSGEGAGAYSPESNKDHGTNQWNGCRRSDNAWARKLVLPGTSQSLGTISDGFGKDAELGFVACSGAMTKNVAAYVPSGNSPQRHLEGQFHEVAQTDSGVLSADTTLVMLTLGGNDEGGFAFAMQECGGLGNCADDSGFLPKYKTIVDQMIPDLQAVLEDVAVKAPNAQIVLMGYPELLSRTVKCAGSLYYDMTEVQALAALVNYAAGKQKDLTDTLRTGASKIKVEYANPVSAFVGHGGCDDPEWINKIVIGPNGDGDFHQGDPAAVPASCLWGIAGDTCISRESFHPKDSGTTGYATVMSNRLSEIGYKGS